MSSVTDTAGGTSIARQEAALRAALRLGILFSILWLMGIGSAIALYNGFKARRIVQASNGQLRGGFTMWWCIVVGALGILVWAPVVLVGLYNRLSSGY